MTIKHIDELLAQELKTIADDVGRASGDIGKGDYQTALGALGNAHERLGRYHATIWTLFEADRRAGKLLAADMKPEVRERFDLYVSTRMEDRKYPLGRVIDLDAEWRNFVADGNVDAEGNLTS